MSFRHYFSERNKKNKNCEDAIKKQLVATPSELHVPHPILILQALTVEVGGLVKLSVAMASLSKQN